MLATLISGTRAGVVWAGISATIIGVSFALFRGGLEPRIDLPPDFLEQGRFMGALFMLVFVFLVTYCYEHLKNRALADLEEEKARQIELRDRLLSHVSHELRTPIAAAEQFVSLVLDGVAGKVEPQQRELLDGALRNTHQLVEMIDHLVTVSRARAAETAPRVELVEIEVEPAVRAAIARHQPEAATHDVSLDVDIEPALPTAHADENAIAAVLDHLLDNAIKYSPAGGRVVVYASRLPSGRVQIGVHDDGPGIHPDQLEEIFDGLQPGPAPEWRSRNGLGLGLAIARVLVEAMDGEISVDSRVGAGSRFDFTMSAIERNHRIES
jgi:signal transduction histidine kinase